MNQRTQGLRPKGWLWTMTTSVKPVIEVIEVGMTCSALHFPQAQRDVLMQRAHCLHTAKHSHAPNNNGTKWVGTWSLYAMYVLDRCLKCGPINSDIFMHFGFPVDEGDEIWFGHSKLKVGIILENRFEVDHQMTSDVRYGLVTLYSKVSRDAQLVELCMKVNWIRRPELNTFWGRSW